jgi:hypothetical protein
MMETRYGPDPVQDAIDADKAGCALAEQLANPRHSSASFEHGTPPPYVSAVWEVLEQIDLDPASSARFNGVVEAAEYFNLAKNGLKQRWRGKVFLNPPGGLVDRDGRPVYIKTKTRASCTLTGLCGLLPGHKHEGVESSAKVWWFKLASEWDLGRVEEAIYVGFSLEILQTTQVERVDGLPVPLDFMTCFPSERVKYLSEDENGKLTPGEQPTHSSFFTYIGPNTSKFREVFSKFGRVVG